MMKNSDTIGIYIHIPFCIRKCNYCDFLSFPSDDNMQGIYIDALISEMRRFSDTENNKLVDTVFIGGGTPSVLSNSLLKRLLPEIADCFSLTDKCEITMEINPGTVDIDKLALINFFGINRISMGVQSMNDEMLKRLGRIHLVKDVYKTYDQLRNTGFDNINMDLMFALPGQGLEIWDDTLNKALALKPEHISFYGLTIEEGTPFYEKYKSGEIILTDDELDRKMYHYACERLKREGYEHYEISNAALPGYESKHNLKYWNMSDYQGFGLGSHSFINGKRCANTNNLEEYIRIYSNSDIKEKIDCQWQHLNTEKENMEEFMFTGLRKIQGINIFEFEKKFKTNIYDIYGRKIKDFIEKGLLEEEGDKIHLTEFGIDVSNKVMQEFLFDKE